MSVSTLTARVDVARLMPWLGRIATLMMLALLAWLGANIFWSLTAPESPRPAAAIDTDLQRTVPALVDRHLFGVYQSAAPAAAPSNIKLNGVIAAQQPGHHSYALIVVEGKPAQLVREGDEISPGVAVRKVMARQVEILRGGQTQLLSLPGSAKPLADPNKAGTTASPAPPAISQPVVTTPPPPQRSKSRRNYPDDS